MFWRANVKLGVRVNPELDKQVNSGFRGKWVNGDNIGKEEADIVALWNTNHPDDQIAV